MIESRAKRTALIRRVSRGTVSRLREKEEPHIVSVHLCHKLARLSRFMR
jgi:hypothetical protein